MARKIIYRKGGLNNQSPAPNGYKYVGYDALTFSEKDGNIISPIGTGSEIIIEETYVNVETLKYIKELEVGKTYFISDKDIWVTTLDIDTFIPEAIRKFKIIKNEFYIPNNITIGSLTKRYLGIYGQGIPMYNTPPSDSINEYYAIWGGKLWKRNSDTNEQPISNIELSGWDIHPISESEYEYKLFNIEYDFESDIISQQSDNRGNIIYSSPDHINYIDNTDWGCLSIYNNKSTGILNNHGDGYNNINFNTTEIHSNDTQSPIIRNRGYHTIRNNSYLNLVANNNSTGNRILEPTIEEVTYYTIDMMDEQEGIIYADHYNFYLTELIKITNNTNVDIKVGGNSINFDPNSKYYVGRGEGISISSDGPCVIQIKVTI